MCHIEYAINSASRLRARPTAGRNRFAGRAGTFGEKPAAGSSKINDLSRTPVRVVYGLKVEGSGGSTVLMPLDQKTFRPPDFAGMSITFN